MCVHTSARVIQRKLVCACLSPGQALRRTAEVCLVKELLIVFSPSRLSFLGGRGKAYQSDEVGKIKLEQQTKLKLKTIEKID